MCIRYWLWDDTSDECEQMPSLLDEGREAREKSLDEKVKIKY
jgi:hypothetical protein